MAVYFATLTRVLPGPAERTQRVLGLYRINPAAVVTFGPHPAEEADGNAGTMTEILLSTGHSMFVMETPAEVSRALQGQIF